MKLSRIICAASIVVLGLLATTDSNAQVSVRIGPKPAHHHRVVHRRVVVREHPVGHQRVVVRHGRGHHYGHR